MSSIDDHGFRANDAPTTSQPTSNRSTRRGEKGRETRGKEALQRFHATVDRSLTSDETKSILSNLSTNFVIRSNLLPVTTRGIGFTTLLSFEKYSNVKRPNTLTVFMVYRIALCQYAYQY